MKVKLETQKTSFEEIEIEFPFYEKIDEFGGDSEMPFESYVKMTKTHYTKITIKQLEINIIHFKRKFNYLGCESAEHIDYQAENKEAFEKALNEVKADVLKL